MAKEACLSKLKDLIKFNSDFKMCLNYQTPYTKRKCLPSAAAVNMDTDDASAKRPKIDMKLAMPTNTEQSLHHVVQSAQSTNCPLSMFHFDENYHDVASATSTSSQQHSRKSWSKLSVCSTLGLQVDKDANSKLQPRPSKRRLPYAHTTSSTYEMKMQLSQMRASQRKERSRLAAQIRRNREAQSLMLIQNALPISAHVLGLESAVKNEQLAKHHSSRAAAMNLEKTGALSIAGHTLFLLNRLSTYLCQTSEIQFSLQSQSMYGLIVDSNHQRIVYASPGLAKVIGCSWIKLIGSPLANYFKFIDQSSNALSSTTHQQSDHFGSDCIPMQIETDQFVMLSSRTNSSTSANQSSSSASDRKKANEMLCYCWTTSPIDCLSNLPPLDLLDPFLSNFDMSQLNSLSPLMIDQWSSSDDWDTTSDDVFPSTSSSAAESTTIDSADLVLHLLQPVGRQWTSGNLSKKTSKVDDVRWWIEDGGGGGLCSRWPMGSMWLDGLLQIRKIDGGGSSFCSHNEGSSSCWMGRSFCSFVHLDDLNAFVDRLTQIKQSERIGWTQPYRIFSFCSLCFPQTDSTDKSVCINRNYVWIRSLVCSNQKSSTVQLMHQSIGFSQECQVGLIPPYLQLSKTATGAADVKNQTTLTAVTKTPSSKPVRLMMMTMMLVKRQNEANSVGMHDGVTTRQLVPVFQRLTNGPIAHGMVTEKMTLLDPSRGSPLSLSSSSSSHRISVRMPTPRPTVPFMNITMLPEALSSSTT